MVCDGLDFDFGNCVDVCDVLCVCDVFLLGCCCGYVYFDDFVGDVLWGGWWCVCLCVFGEYLLYGFVVCVLVECVGCWWWYVGVCVGDF